MYWDKEFLLHEVKRDYTMINTVLGNVGESEIKAALCHEHICCYSEYLKMMSGGKLFDKEELIMAAVSRFKWLKDKYNVNLFVDCTPVNIGRNIDLLKLISKRTGVHIVCSTGFYYTEECLLFNTPVEFFTELYINDAKNVNAGVIKVAVENKSLSMLNKKLLIASANAQLQTGLPIIMHTNAENQNGTSALELLISEGVPTTAITVGHLSDTDDMDYILKIAQYGCYIGLDRLHENTTEEYIQKKLKTVNTLIEAGFMDRIILSHDALVYNGFDREPKINNNARYNYVFDNIFSRLPKEIAQTVYKRNPIRMLSCQ